MSHPNTHATARVARGCPVVYYPDPVLRRKTRPIEEIDEEVRENAEAMLDIMYEARGVGLAAPQVGWRARICVLNCTGREEDEGVFINPAMLNAEGEDADDEGCLSLPGIRSKISRAARVEIQAYDLDGNEVHIEAEGLSARAWQHEIDHLDGVLILDRMSPAARLFHMRRLKELEAEYRERARQRS